MNLIPVYERRAEHELAQAIDFYEDRVPLLGQAFYAEVKEAVQRACHGPKRFMVIPGPSPYEVRRVLVKRFPYMVVFTVRLNELHVLAVSHKRRAPGYWQTRLP